jgi:hypothetical protein
MSLDLDGPLDDFHRRTSEIRAIIVAVESASRDKAALTTARPNIDLSLIGAQTGNTVNAMSLVFLASSFEEFIREEIAQGANYMSSRYLHLDEKIRNSVRNSYWSACLDRLRMSSSILTKTKPKSLNVTTLGKVGVLLDSARSFVVSDDASTIDPSVFYQHSRNFRPHVVDEIAFRVGIENVIDNAADGGKIKAYFGVTKKSDSSKKLRNKLNEFYEIRNNIVHSLSGSAGYGVDAVLDYIELFEATADSVKGVLVKATATW